MKRSLAIVLLAMILIGLNTVEADLLEREAKKIPIAKFKIGMKENEIPNENVNGDLCNSPSGLFVDSNNNIYVFIQGINEIKKFTSQGKYIKTFQLNDYVRRIYGSMFLDKETDKIYFLTFKEVHIFDCDFNYLSKIDISDIFAGKRPDRIKVFKEKIFLHEGDYGDIDVVEKVNNKYVFKKDKYIIIDNLFIKKASQSKVFGEHKYIFFDSTNKQKEIALPKETDFGCFIGATNSNLYLYLSFSSPYNRMIKFPKMMIVDESLKTFLVSLHEDKLSEGNYIPLINIDNKGNIVHLCLENNMFVLYYYQIF